MQGQRMLAPGDSSVLCKAGQVPPLCSHRYREGLADANSTLSLELAPQSSAKVFLGLFSHREPRKLLGGLTGVRHWKDRIGHQFRDRFKTFLRR